MPTEQKKFYITTPIYYVNAQPHIGHTYTTIFADILARYHRMVGDKSFFLTGTDEHGAKIEEKAKEAGIDPQKFADGVSASFQSAWQKLDISNDNFIRTTDKSHILAVQAAVQRMYDQGDIYKGTYEGLYCRGCEQFLQEKDLVDGLCPDHKKPPEKLVEESYMFRLSKYQDILLSKIKNNELQILPEERKNEIISFYEKEGLQDISFSRQNVSWGIQIPWDESHTIYVWADAFLNYLTGLGWDGLNSGENMEFWPADIHIMSKDILRVHSTIWLAMLLALNLPLPKAIFVHGYFLSDGQKMSKSLGNVISPDSLLERYGVDATRYLLVSAMSYGRDGDITWQWLDDKYGADLANGLGNLVARVSNLMEKNSIILDLSIDYKENFSGRYYEAINNLYLDEAIKVLWNILRRSDEILSEKQPWKMQDINDIKAVLEPIALDILKVSELLIPYMPQTAIKIISTFTAEKITKSEPLFPRI